MILLWALFSTTSAFGCGLFGGLGGGGCGCGGTPTIGPLPCAPAPPPPPPPVLPPAPCPPQPLCLPPFCGQPAPCGGQLIPPTRPAPLPPLPPPIPLPQPAPLPQPFPQPFPQPLPCGIQPHFTGTPCGGQQVVIGPQPVAPQPMPIGCGIGQVITQTGGCMPAVHEITPAQTYSTGFAPATAAFQPAQQPVFSHSVDPGLGYIEPTQSTIPVEVLSAHGPAYEPQMDRTASVDLRQPIHPSNHYRRKSIEVGMEGNTIKTVNGQELSEPDLMEDSFEEALKREAPSNAGIEVKPTINSQETEKIPVAPIGNKKETSMIDISEIKLSDDPMCNAEELRSIMLQQMSDSLNSSKRMVQMAAEERFGGRFDVICAHGDFSYVTNTELFCQETKNTVSCYVYRQI